MQAELENRTRYDRIEVSPDTKPDTCSDIPRLRGATIMKTTIAAVALLIGMGLSVYGDDTKPKVGEWATASGLMTANTCRSLDDLVRYRQLFRSGDLVATAEFYRQHCTHIERNTEVMVEDQSVLNGALYVRPMGQQACLWTNDLIYRSFDQQHPECKEWKTNKNLPEHCY